MIKIISFCAVVAVSLASIQGCSVSRVFSSPPPVEVERVKVGESRNTIITVLGTPKTTETKPDQSKLDMYEFVDGHSGASKLRAIVYIAGDLFTIGLSELVFWPIELAAGNGTAGRAIVNYGMDDLAKSVLLTRANGKPWDSSVEVSEDKPVKDVKVTNKINPETGSIIQ